MTKRLDLIKKQLKMSTTLPPGTAGSPNEWPMGSQHSHDHHEHSADGSCCGCGHDHDDDEDDVTDPRGGRCC